MSFAGGGGNITIAINPHLFCIVNIKLDFLYLIFYACLRLRFLDVQTNPGPLRPDPAVRRTWSLLSAVMGGAWPGTLMTWPWLRLSMIYCCALRLWSQICNTYQSCWLPDSAALSCCVGARCFGPEGWLHSYEMVKEHFANINLSVVVAKWWFLLCGVRQNLYVFSLNSNPDQHDRIFYCLLASIATVHAEDIRASFRFVGDLNGHHQEWLCYTTTNRHGVAAFHFVTVSGFDQLVVGPTNARGRILALLMTAVPDLVLVTVVAPIGNSDHSSLSAVILMAQAVIFGDSFPSGHYLI